MEGVRLRVLEKVLWLCRPHGEGCGWADGLDTSGELSSQLNASLLSTAASEPEPFKKTVSPMPCAPSHLRPTDLCPSPVCSSRLLWGPGSASPSDGLGPVSRAFTTRLPPTAPFRLWLCLEASGSPSSPCCSAPGFRAPFSVCSLISH